MKSSVRFLHASRSLLFKPQKFKKWNSSRRKQSILEKIEVFSDKEHKFRNPIVYGIAFYGLAIMAKDARDRFLYEKRENIFAHIQNSKAPISLSLQLYDKTFGTTTTTSIKQLDAPDEIYELVKTVCEDIKLPPETQDSLRVFYSDNLTSEVQIVSTLKSVIERGSIGIPYYTKFQDVNEVNFNDLRHKIVPLPLFGWLGNIQIDLSEVEETEENAKDLHELRKTFVMSDKAKKFMIATYLVEANVTSVAMAKMMQHFLFVLLAVGSSATINDQFKMFGKKFLCTQVGRSYIFMTQTQPVHSVEITEIHSRFFFWKKVTIAMFCKKLNMLNFCKNAWERFSEI